MRILLITNPTAFAWNPGDLSNLGGGEEAIVLWAQAMSRRGHDVTVVYDGPDGRIDGVEYQSRANTPLRDGRAFDVLICRKLPEAAGMADAPQKVLWTDQHRAADYAPFRRIVCVSPFLQRLMAATFPVLTGRLSALPDGINPAAFPEPRPERERDLVLHASSPDRGLETLLRLWPRVLERRPDTRLQIAYGWDLYLACGGDPRLKDRIDAAVANLPGITMGRVPYADMHALYCRAGIWAYYCTQGEFFCQVAVKAQHGGAVPVVRPWGALHDTVWSGLRVQSDDEFVAAMVRALDPAEQDRLREGVVSMAVSWDDVAAEWERLLLDTSPVVSVGLPQVPGIPPQLAATPGAGVLPLVQQLAQQWGQAQQIQRPWVEPTLGLSAAVPTPAASDGALLGFLLEDTPDDPATALRALQLPTGLPVMLLTSTGTWRADRRQRVFDRQQLDLLVERMGAVETQTFPLDGEGNGVTATVVRWDPAGLGQRDVAGFVARLPVRETVSVCFMCPPTFEHGKFADALRSVAPIADEVVVAVNGPRGPQTAQTVETADVLERFERDTRIPVRWVDALPPYYCFDCLGLHEPQSCPPGHRLAGFETARNQSIAPARGDWVLWCDSDETLCEPLRLTKYLRPNCYEGYGIPQDHFSSDPPQAYKRDTPCRLFRRRPDGSTPGWHDVNGWPTFNPGFTARFAGIVHEHPGQVPTYAEGLGPMLVIPEVYLAHTGYLTEPIRRRRFVRNWPLMLADRQKYPQRRLGRFLWLRDLSHHARYELELARGVVSPSIVAYAEEGIRVFEELFAESADLFFGDALDYVRVCYEVLRRGVQVEVAIKVTKPEIGPDPVLVQFAGRVGSAEQLLRLVQHGLGGCSRWDGPYP